MLLGNSSVLHKLPLKFYGGSGASVEPKLPSNFDKSGPRRNRLYIDQRTTAQNLWAVPTGCYAGTAWMLPQDAGEIRSNAYSVSAGSGVLAGGKNLSGQADSVSSATGTGYVLSNTSGTAASVSSASGTLFGTAPLMGSASSTSTATGSVTAPGAVVGTASSASSASGSVVAILAADGASLSVSSASGTLFAASFLAGVANSVSAANGSAFGVRYAQGAANSVSSASGSVTGLGWVGGASGSTSSASLVAYATGSIAGESTTVQALSPDGLAKAVWNSVAVQFAESGSMGAKLNSAASGGIDYAALGQAVWEHAQRSLSGVVDANMVKVKGQSVAGTGVSGDPWGPA